jgi:hypothetical protein
MLTFFGKRKKMKKIIALSLALLTFVMPVNAGWYADWAANHRKKETQCLWAILQRQIVEIDKQVKIQNQAADKLDKYSHFDDLEANEKYEYKYNLETIKYWERRKNAAATAIRYNELIGDKDALEREKGYVAEAKKNIDLLSAKLTDENSETKVSFYSKVFKNVKAIYDALDGNAFICGAAIMGSLVVFTHGVRRIEQLKDLG